MTIAYRGRFAPSPTGPLHFGSLIAAMGSYLDARAQGGEWLLRVEDIDVPRCKPEHESAILHALEAYGFEWDGIVLRQSERNAIYQNALETLKTAGLVYPCACSRKEIADSSTGVDGAPVYPGTCRAGLPEGKAGRAWRLRVEIEDIACEDAVFGQLSQNLKRDVGDFVLWRADGLVAYQLAVVVDDALQGVTHIVRGADLLHSTPRQIYLQHCLKVPVPQYAHLPVAVNAAGEKLSKQTFAAPLDTEAPLPILLRAAAFLGMTVTKFDGAHQQDFWKWVIMNWKLHRVPKNPFINVSEGVHHDHQ